MVQIHRSRRNFHGDIVFAFALGAACYLIWLIRDVLLLLYVSALFAVVLMPLVRATANFRIRKWQPFKGMPILFLLLGAAGILTAFGFLALPPVLRDLQGLSKEIPMRAPAIVDKLHNIPFADRLNTNEINARIQGFASQAATYVLLSIRNWAGKLFDLAMGIFLTVYFILEGDKAYHWFLSFFPPDRRYRLDNALQRADARMGRWLLGQGSLMLILGVCSTLTFLVLHVRYAYALGMLTGLLNLIPVLGVGISVVLAMIVAAFDSWGRVLGVAIFFLVYVQVENSFLTPRIMQSTVKLPGLAIIVALVLGSAMEGVLGAMVCVPTAALVAVLLDEYLVHRDAV